MAQHIPIARMGHAKIRKIEKVVRNDFERSKGYMKGSLKYQFLGVQEGQNVYVIHKAVPGSIVSGGQATIEIHQDPGTRQITQIYFVA